MRVLLWGDYNQGNFGDDAMAVVFASGLQRAGHDVTVAGAREGLIREIGTVHRLERLDAPTAATFDVAVIGGGGVLTRQPPYWRLRRTRRDAERRFRHLADVLDAAQLPVAAVSIGGDGASDLAELTISRRRVAAHPNLQGVTLRLRSDQPLFDDRGVPVVHAPDVLYSLADFLGVAPGQQGGGVGINLKKWQAPRIRRSVTSVVGDGLVAVRTHTPDSGHTYESLAGAGGHIEFTTVRGFVHELARLDLLITSKLHVGLVALTLDVPVICVEPPAKVVAEMEQLGLDNVARDPGHLRELLQTWRDGETAPLLPARDVLEARRTSSLVHVDQLLSWLPRLQRGA